MDCGAGKGVHGEEPCGEKHGRVFGTSFDTRRARVWYIFGTEYQNVSKPVLVLSTKTYQSVPKRVSKVPKPVLIRFDTK